jgi:hypothetical protein
MRGSLMFKRLLAAAVLAVVSTSSPARERVVITYDGGGRVAEYNRKWAEYARSHTRVVVDGRCISACARYMSLPSVCATTRGYFYLHGVTYENVVYRQDGIEDSRKYDTARGFALESRYDTFSMGVVPTRPARVVALEPGISKVYHSISESGGPPYQVFLRVKATLLVPPCQ